MTALLDHFLEDKVVITARGGSGNYTTPGDATAGGTQKVVSDDDCDRREPALATRRRLVAATGHTLDVALSSVAAERHRPGVLADRLHLHRDQVVTLAATRGAVNLRVFGSVARGEEGPTSDIDLLVDLAPGTGLFALLALRDGLSDLLAVAVDVVPADSLKPRVARAVLAEAVPL